MSKNSYISVNSVAKKIGKYYVGDEKGLSRKVSVGYVGDSDGVARVFYKAHDHTWSYSYSWVDRSQHNITCSCDSCGEVESVTPTNHTAGSSISVWYNDATQHWTYKKCKYCGGETSTYGTSKTSHSWTTTSNSATCTASGKKKSTCYTCGATKTEDSSAKGHDHQTVTVAATCTTMGSTSQVCSRCGHVKSTTTIPINPSAHENTIDRKFLPTCTEGTRVETYCIACEKVIASVENTDALGHNYQYISTTAPTCTEQGYDYYKCSRCNAVKYINYVAATGHKWESRGSGNKTKYVCVNDGCDEESQFMY